MILILTQCYPPDLGGIQSLVGGLSTALARAGHQVLVMAEHAKGAQTQDAAVPGLVVQRYGGPRPVRRHWKAWTARRLIRSGRIEAIFCDSWKSSELVDPGPVPMAVLAHGNEFPIDASGGKRGRITKALAKAHCVLASSRYTANLARPYLAPTTILDVVPPPISPQPEPTTEAIAKLSALTGGARPLLAGLARLEPRKGFDMVIAALPELARRWPGIALALGGGGEDAERLRTLAAQHGVADHVHLLGRIDDAAKAALLATADVFAMPTRRDGNSVEGFGIVYAEAAWYGTPSLAGTEGGAGEIVVDDVTGRQVPGHDPAAVASALGDLLGDEATRNRMGAEARKRVQNSGTWQASLPRYLASVSLPSTPSAKG